jgi:hypothetical protein
MSKFKVYEFKANEFSTTLMCHYVYTPRVAGAREPMTGLQLEPDEPADVALYDIQVSGVSINDYVSNVWIDRIAEEIKRSEGE